MSERYALLRLEDRSLGPREAARQVGFSGGVPSPSARELWKKVELLEMRGARPDFIAGRINKLRQELRRLEVMQQAAKLVQMSA